MSHFTFLKIHHRLKCQWLTFSEYEAQLCASAYLESVLSVELTDIAAKDIWTPDNGEVLRGHPRTVGVQRHLVQVPHQKVDRPEIKRQKRIYHGVW